MSGTLAPLHERKTFDVNNKSMVHVEDYDRITVVIM